MLYCATATGALCSSLLWMCVLPQYTSSIRLCSIILQEERREREKERALCATVLKALHHRPGEGLDSS